MSEHPHPLNEPVPAGHPQRITDADQSRSADMHSRTVKYTISMSVRMACFITAFFVHGWIQIVMLVFAVVLPYFAVVVANASGADLAKRTDMNYYEAGAAGPSKLEGSPTGNAGHAGPQAPPPEDAPRSPDNGRDEHGAFAAGPAAADRTQDDAPVVLSGQWYDPEGVQEDPADEKPAHHRHGLRHPPGTEGERG